MRMLRDPCAGQQLDRRSASHAAVAVLFAAAFAGACAVPAPVPAPAELNAQVVATERAFARTMADRDYQAFTTFIADDAIFFGGPQPLRGKEAVTAAWKRFYEQPAAPFSWAPETVEVLASGTLASSSGPVRDRDGKVVATFNSIWRLEAPGKWRIVFDRGNDVCECAKAP
jgi:ketosteroid isomerase-like protein